MWYIFFMQNRNYYQESNKVVQVCVCVSLRVRLQKIMKTFYCKTSYYQFKSSKGMNYGQDKVCTVGSTNKGLMKAKSQICVRKTVSHEKIIQQSLPPDCSDQHCIDDCLLWLPEPFMPSPCLPVIEKSSSSELFFFFLPFTMHPQNRKTNSGKRPPNVINFLGVGGCADWVLLLQEEEF